MVVRSGRAPLVPYTVMSPVTRPVPGSTNTARDSPRSSAGSANITRVVPPSDAGRTFTGESGEPIERIIGIALIAVEGRVAVWVVCKMRKILIEVVYSIILAIFLETVVEWVISILMDKWA